MSLRRSLAIFKHEMRVMWTDPSTVIFVVVMPLLMVALMKKLFAQSLAAEGYANTNGSEFAVPGMAVSFAAFGVGYAGFTFFRDHGWATWDRLRASAATSTELMVGKVLPTVLVTTTQLGLLFALGGPLFGLSVRGSVLGVVLIIVVLSLALCAFGMLITALAKTMGQLNAIGSVGGMAMAMMGGSWIPVSAMPGWAQLVAPALPSYWAMEGFRGLVLDGAGVVDVLPHAAVLLGFGVLFTALAAWRFRFEDSKVYWG